MTLASLAFLALAALGAIDPATPKQSIEGAEQPVPLGEVVVLTVSDPNPATPNWLSTTYDWKVIDLADGREIRLLPYRSEKGKDGVFFGAGIKKRKLKAFCAATHLFALKEGAAVKEVATRTALLSADVQLGEKEPDPPVPPPAPVDPLAKAFFDAFSLDKDADKASTLPLWGQFYRSAADASQDKKLLSWGQLFKVLEATASATKLAGKTMSLQGAIQAHLKSKLPYAAANVKPLDDDGRALAKKVFLEVAAAVDAVRGVK